MDDDDRTPGQKLQQIIKERNLSKAALARKIFGEKATHLRIHRFTKDRGFNARNQELVAKELGLAPTYFRETDKAAIKEEYRQKIFGQFKRSDLGREASPHELRILDAIPFVDEILPELPFYTLTYLALKNRLSKEEYEALLQKNRALLDSAKKKRAKRTK